MMTAQQILVALDDACRRNSFPMLDNGHVFDAATRLSLYRSAEDWAMTIEVFGFSPHAGMPYTCLNTFGSTIERTKLASDYAAPEAFEAYLHASPHNETTFLHPIDVARHRRRGGSARKLIPRLARHDTSRNDAHGDCGGRYHAVRPSACHGLRTVPLARRGRSRPRAG
jgi:hypothetical protein